MAQHVGLYARPYYYDVVFKADVTEEVNFLLEAFALHTGRAATSALEVAAGPGYHARALARRGVRAVGLDLSHEMMAFARAAACAEGVEVEWIVGDMRHFTLDRPVDLVFCTLDGVDCLLDDMDMVDHIRSVARNLRPEGLYVIEFSHPRDCSPGQYGTFRYHGRAEHCDVEIVWATNRPSADAATRVLPVEVTMRVTENGRSSTVTDLAYERFFSQEELVELSARSGLMKVAAWYGDFSIGQPFDDSAASTRMLCVLQRTSTEG